MPNTTQRPLMHLALWFVLAILAICVHTASAGEPIRLGMSAAFTGPSGGLGVELYRGSAAAFNKLNKAGGINGNPVVIVCRDDRYQPNPAIENTIEFLKDDSILCLFNYVGTPTVARTLPLLKGYKGRRKPMFFPFSGAAPQRDGPYSDYVFNLRTSYRQELAGLVNKFMEIGHRRLAVFYQADAYGRSGWDGARRALAVYGNKLVGEATYTRGAKFADSMAEQVRILKRTRPDAILSIGSYAACAAFIRDARNMGLDIPIANVSFVGCENMLALLKEEGERSGRDYTNGLVNSQVVPSYEDLSLPAVREYRKVMEDDPPQPPHLADPDYRPLKYSFTSFEGYLNAKVMTRILQEYAAHPFLGLTGNTESLRDENFGIDVPITFGPYRHQGLDKVYFITVRDGKIVPMSQEQWKAWQK